MARWESALPPERLSLEPELQRYLERHGTDDSVLRVRLLLVRVALDRGDIALAESRLPDLQTLPRGALRDHARLLSAMIALRHGKPDSALQQLSNVERSLIDEEQRLDCGELRITAALEARRWALALEAMTALLAETSGTRALEVQRRCRIGLERLPITAKLAFIEAPPPADTTEAEGAAHAWLRKVAAAGVAEQALTEGDGSLAQRLLATSAGNELSRAEREALLAAAATTHDEHTGIGRALVLLLDTDNEKLDRRAAEVTRGVDAVLRAQPRDAEATRLIVTSPARRGEELADLLLRLESRGPTIVLAGLDATSASKVAEAASIGTLPVVLLTPPLQTIAPSGPLFVLGESEAPQRAAIGRTLGTEAALRVVDVEQSGLCERNPGDSPTLRGRLLPWRERPPAAVVMLDRPTCGGELMEELGRDFPKLPIVLGLGASTMRGLSKTSPVYYLAAGRFPDEATDTTHGSATDLPWFEALGRDAAALTTAALQAVPLRGEDTPRPGALHQELTEALTYADVPLLTSESHGFSGGRALSRRIVALSRTPSAAAATHVP